MDDWKYVVVIVRNDGMFDGLLGLFLSDDQAITAIKHAKKEDQKEGYEGMYEYRIVALDIKIMPEED